MGDLREVDFDVLGATPFGVCASLSTHLNLPRIDLLKVDNLEEDCWEP